METVLFNGEQVTPLNLQFGVEWISLYGLLLFATYWILFIAKQRKLAMKIALTGVSAPLGGAAASLIVGIPLTLFSDTLYPISHSSIDSIFVITSAIGFGWWARIAWEHDTVLR